MAYRESGPPLPIRQWVLSLPFALRYRLVYDARLVREVMQIFVQTIFGSLRRRAGVPAVHSAAKLSLTFREQEGLTRCCWQGKCVKTPYPAASFWSEIAAVICLGFWQSRQTGRS
jgi:hypothetical protein